MDRGAWRALVHGVAQTHTERTHHARKRCTSTWPRGLSFRAGPGGGVLWEWWCHSSVSDSCGGNADFILNLLNLQTELVNDLLLPACSPV